MKTLKANIPSEKEFLVNENGEIFNHSGKQLTGKLNPNSKTLRSLDFLNNDKKRQVMSFQKIVWNTFNPKNPVLKSEIIVLKNAKTKYPFALSNLEKVTRKENVEKINKIRLEKVEIKKNIT